MNESARKRDVVRGILFVLSLFLLALCYNLFFLPNDLVIGGVSGLSIIFQQLLDIDPQVFIYISSGILIICSYLFLGKEKTKNTILGAIIYPIMVTFTFPIANVILENFTFDDIWVIIIFSGLLFGFSSGLVFRYGYSTGGSDIMISIFSKYFKAPEGKSMLFLNIGIIILSGFTFGLNLMIYAIFILYLSSVILDKVMFDISNSKVFYVFSDKEAEVKKIILDEFKTGFTELPTVGGYTKKKGKLLMSVVPNREYFHFKNRILEIDPGAFFMITDCYESLGGYRKKNIPYL